jgi:prophage antirepressor-like protein
MTQSLQLFEYNNQQVRTVLMNGEPFFVLNDLCKILGIANPRNVVDRIDPLTVRKTDVENSRGQMRETTVVDESGMYEVVIRSNGEVAKPFRRWITHEVLPSIRKTGQYSVDQDDEKFLALAVVKAQNVIERKDQQIAELKPKADYSDMISKSEGLRTINDLANDLKVHAASNHPGVKVYNQQVFDLAGELGLIIRGNTVRHNQPTARAIEANWVSPAETTYKRKSGELVTKRYARLTPRGYSRVWETAVHRLNNNLPLVTQKQKELA